MATIGLLTVGITGRVNASCEIARRLGARGHRVILASTDARVPARLNGADLPFYALHDGVPAQLKEQMRAQPKGAARRRLRAAIAAARGQASLAGQGIDAFIAGHNPDLLLVESELHHNILFLRNANVPVALLEYHISVRRRRGVPPLSSGLAPARNLAEAARIDAVWRWTLGKRRFRHLIERAALSGWDPRSVWQRLAHSSGVALSAIAREDQWPLLYYPNLPCIDLCGAELDFDPVNAPARSFAGPVINRQRPDPPGDEDARACREWLAARDRGRPLVASATGSILTLPAFTRKIVQAATGAGFDLVVSTGRDADPASLGKLPPNVRAYRLIPQLDVLLEAKVFVCHGGITSIHEAILAGCPMLLCSAGCMDEDGNAARAIFHGLGIRGDMRRDSATDLRQKIAALLDDGGARDAVAALGNKLRSYESEQRLENLVDALLPRR